MNFRNDITFAAQLDQEDQLREFRNQFHFPKHTDGTDILYFCGNSLGLQPKSAKAVNDEMMTAWKDRAVEGHFEGAQPWLSYNDDLSERLAVLMGAQPKEVSVLNTLTVNLHFMMISFYRPTKSRFKIVIEGGAFPSDQYAVKSQIEHHGFDIKEALIELFPREGEDLLRTEDIVKTIQENGDEIALVMMSGLNYYTGQVYDMEKITKAGYEVGAKVGFDLAHAAGNVQLKLHEWQIDFAVWCTYKYLNGGPGSVGAIFVHQKHFDKNLPRLAGWYGNKRATRFLMKDTFEPMEGAPGWQMSTGSVGAMTGLRASLAIFEEAGFENLLNKSKKLTAYLAFLMEQIDTDVVKIITPKNEQFRGCQLSIRVKNSSRSLFDNLRAQGVIGDWREPDVIRIASVPLYNSFTDVYRFVEIIKTCI